MYSIHHSLSSIIFKYFSFFLRQSQLVLYSRHDIVALVNQQPAELRALITACIWYFSRCDSSLIENNRYGLLQIDLAQAKSLGFDSNPNDLLNPETNINLGSQLLSSLGLVQFAGRIHAHQLPLVIQLASFLSRPQS